MSHANARLTVEGRRRLCLHVDAGRPRAHVAAEAGISANACRSGTPAGAPTERPGCASTPAGPPTAPTGCRWMCRAASSGCAASASWARPGSPLNCAPRTSQISASGVHRVLVRLGISRLRDLDRPTGEQLRRATATNATAPVSWSIST